MKAVHVLKRRNCPDDRVRINLARNRQLHENTVYRGICVQLFYFRNQFLLRCFLRKKNLPRDNSAVFTGTLFVADINLACRIAADKNDSQRNLYAALRKRLDFLLHFVSDLRRYFLSVNDRCHQRLLSQTLFCARYVSNSPSSMRIILALVPSESATTPASQS